MTAAQDQGDAHDGRAGAGREDRLLAGELGASVDAQRARRVVLPDEGTIAAEDEIGRERDEAQASLAALPRQGAGQARVDPLRLVGPLLAVVGLADGGRVHDGVGPRGVEKAGEGLLVGQLDEHGTGAGRRDREAVRRQDLETPSVKELGEAAAEKTARAR